MTDTPNATKKECDIGSERDCRDHIRWLNYVETVRCWDPEYGR